MSEQTPTDEMIVPIRVECRTTTEPFVRMMSVAAMLAGVGVWCIIDQGQYKYVKFSEDESKYLGWAFNYYGQFVFTAVGAAMMIWTVLWSRKRMVADNSGIGYLNQPQIPWDGISKVDAKALRDKGYLYIYHGQKRLTLDAWKLQNFRDLVLKIEKHVPADRIVR